MKDVRPTGAGEEAPEGVVGKQTTRSGRESINGTLMGFHVDTSELGSLGTTLTSKKQRGVEYCSPKKNNSTRTNLSHTVDGIG